MTLFYRRFLSALLWFIVMGGTAMQANAKQEFAQAILDTGSRKFESLTLKEFLPRRIRIRSGDGVIAYSFSGHAYLAEIVKAGRHPDMVAMKAAQVGWTTFMIGRMMWILDGTSLKAAVFFPDADSMKVLVQDRFDPLISDSPYFAKLRGDSDSTDNVKLKKFGQFTISFRATSTKTGVKTYDSDVNILDEVDEHDPENLAFTDDRMLHSKIRIRMAGSQPSVPNYGIHADFLDTDQRWYLVRCGCGHWTNLVERFQEDHDSIFVTVRNRKEYCCEKCGRKIDNQKGQYVAKLPDRPRAGFQISQFFTKTFSPADASDRWKKAQLTSIGVKNYMISIVGLPHATADEQPVTQSLLDAHRGIHGLRTDSPYWTYMGSDQGDTVHTVWGEPTGDGRIKIIGLGKFHIVDEDRFDQSMIQFSVYQACIDAMPNKSWSLKRALRFPDNVRIQYFTKRFRESEELIPGFPEGIDVVAVNRDESLEATIDDIKRGRFIFPQKAGLAPPDLALLEEFEIHLKNLIRVRGEDENGKPIFSFKKKIANHFGMALNSLRLAADLTPGTDAGGVLFG